MSWLANYAARWFANWLGAIVEVIREDEDSRTLRLPKWAARARVLVLRPLETSLARVRARGLVEVAATAVIRAARPLEALLGPIRTWTLVPHAGRARPVGLEARAELGLARGRAGARAQAGVPATLALGAPLATAGAVPGPLTLTMGVGAVGWPTRASVMPLTELVAKSGQLSHSGAASAAPLQGVAAELGAVTAGAVARAPGVQAQMLVGTSKVYGADEEEEIMELILTGVL